MRNHDPIPLFEFFHAFSCLNDFSRYLVPKDPGSLLEPVPLHHIAATNARCHDFYYEFTSARDWFWSFLYSHILVCIIHGYLHRVPLSFLFFLKNLVGLLWSGLAMNYRLHSLNHCGRVFRLEDVPAHVDANGPSL